MSNNHLSLFNLPAFSELPNDGRRYERIDVINDGRFVGTLAGIVSGGEFVSGYGASFGGMDFVRERETLEIVMAAVDDATDQIRRLGISRIRLRGKPFHYSQNEEYLHFALCRSGFSVAEVNLNFYLDLERFANPESYRQSLRHSPDRQLRLALAAKLDWREASSHEDWKSGYEALAANRSRNGATLSLSFERVAEMRARFGERVRMFLLERGCACVAATLLYGISSQHAMVMYWGDQVDRSQAPGDEQLPSGIMNLVAFRTLDAAMTLGYRTLDLGPVSTENGVNLGNARFKASVNAIPNFRYTLERAL